ncbi:MAG: hypothetical protein JNL67_22490 [Planctomycetaceae bacterium]|nr:hypothetical protein [Planctomycetaceae bacterium]
MPDAPKLPEPNLIERHEGSERGVVFAFLAWSGGFQVALALASWSLWFPVLQSAVSEDNSPAPFPSVPWLALASGWTWLEWVLAPVWLGASLVQTITAGALAMAVTRNERQKAPTIRRIEIWLIGSLVLGILTWVALVGWNQHRLQAWAYLATWIHLLFLLGLGKNRENSEAWFAIRQRWSWLIVSVYFYSAVSKFDHLFFVTLGSQFLTTLWNSSTGANLPLETVWPWWMTLAFPLGELMVAIGLANGRTRRPVVFLAMILHGLLLLILGPWGMQHHPGVLLWNLFFIGQLWLLFWPVRPPDANRVPFENWPAQFGLYLVVLLPLAQPWGWCDSWPAWELYAPRGSRIQVFLAAPAIEQLPELAPYVSQDPSPEFGPLWRELRLDQWSLDQRGVPIYPQDRFQLGVAIAVRQRVVDSEQVLIRWLGPANRWTGARDQELLTSSQDIEDFGRRFFWNVQPTGSSSKIE